MSRSLGNNSIDHASTNDNGSITSIRTGDFFKKLNLTGLDIDKLKELGGDKLAAILGSKITGISSPEENNNVKKSTFSIGGITEIIGDFTKNTATNKTSQEEVKDSIQSVLSKTIEGSSININDKLKSINQQTIDNKYPFIGGLTADNYYDNVVAVKNVPTENIISSLQKGVNNTFVSKDLILKNNDVKQLDTMRIHASNVYEPLVVDTYSKKLILSKEPSTLFVTDIKSKTKFGESPSVGDMIKNNSINQTYSKNQEIPDNNFNSFVNYLGDMYKNQKLSTKAAIYERSYTKNENAAVLPNNLDNVSKLISGVNTPTASSSNTVSNKMSDTYISTLASDNTKQSDGVNIMNALTKENNIISGFNFLMNPDVDNIVESTMNKLGLGSLGIGGAVKSYVSTTISFKTIVTIAGVKFDHTCFDTFYEDHDYMKNKMPTRYIKLRMNAKHMKNLKLDGKNKKITIERMYGFRPSANPSTAPVPDMTNYKVFEVLKDYEVKALKQTHKLSKENAKEVEGTEKELKSRAIIEGIIIPPMVTKDQKAKNFNSIPKEAKISAVIAQAFATCYQKGKLAMVKPFNDLVLTNYIIAPMTFPQVVTKLHKDFKLFEGGFNIFIDDDIYYIVNKEGPNIIEFEKDWTYRFETHPKGGFHLKMFTTINQARKKMTLNILEDDVTKLPDKSELKVVEDRYNKGSKVGTTQGTTKDTITTLVKNVNHDYLLGQPESNLPVEDFIVKVSSTHLTLKPGDNIEINYRKKLYKGTVKKWTSEQKQAGRAVIIHVTAKASKTSFLDSLSPDNILDTIQTKASELSARVEDTINNAREGVLGSIEKTTGYDVTEVINYNQTLGSMAKAKDALKGKGVIFL